MATKSQLLSAINSYASARITNDNNLLQFSAQLLQQTIETLEFEPEEGAQESVSGESETQD